MTPKTKRLLLILAAIGLAVSTALEVAIHNHHLDDPHWLVYWWNHVPFFFGALGFVGCYLIIVVSKQLGKWFIDRPEDYYGEKPEVFTNPPDDGHGGHGGHHD